MRFILGIAILLIGLVVLVVNHDSGQSFGMDNEAFGRLVVALSILLMISTGILVGRRSLGQSLRQMAIWVLIALVLVTGYLYRGDFRSIGERVLAGLMPGRAVTVTTADGRAEVILHKTLGGHFETTVDLGTTSVPVLIDTGASSVALRYEPDQGDAAPVCVAKGVDALALRIREVAREHAVPIVENVPLARALYAAVDVDETIPREHFEAAARVIGFVMQGRRRR